MGLFDGLLGGGGGSADDPYADILTPAQRNQMQVQGLLAMAGAFAQAGMPSRLPVPFGSALGSAAAALGTGQEAGMKTAIENALAAQKVRDLRNMAEYRKKVLGDIDPTSPLGRAIDAINNPGGTTPTPGPTPAGPGAGGGGGGGGGAPAGGGGLLSPDLSLGSDTTPDYFTRGLAPKAPGGLLDYPSDQGTMRGGGGLVPERPDAGIGTATPSSAYSPGGSLYPFRDLGVVPGTSSAAPAGPGAGMFARYPDGSLGPVDKYGNPARPVGGTGAAPGGDIRTNSIGERYNPDGELIAPVPPTNGIDPRKRAALDAILAGMQTAQGGPSAQRLAQFAGPGAADAPAADATPEGGGLLGVAPDLRAPIEANPLARVNAVLAQIRQRESSGNYAIPPEKNVDFPRSHASGGYQFQPGTWREWTQKSGFGQEYPQAYLAPAPVQDAVARYAALHGDVNAPSLWGASGTAKGRPYPTPYEAGGPPDELIPSGPGAGGNPPAATLAQYAPGATGAAPGAGMTGGPPLYPSPAANQAAGVSQLIVELARRNAAAEVLGLGNPYGSLLTVLQGSPQYKAQVEAATEQAKRTVGLGFIKEEKRLGAEGELPSLISRDVNKGVIDQLNKQIEQMGAAALNPAGTILVNGPNGPVERQVTQLQSAQARAGFDVPEIGFKGMRGPLPAGQIPGLPGVALPGAPGGPSATGAPGPGPQAQGGTPGGPGTLYDKPVLAPGQQETQQATLGANLARSTAQLKDYNTEGQAAAEQVGNAQAINDLLGRVKLGWGANTRQEAARILTGMGVSKENVQTVLQTDPAAGDELNKLFLQFSAGAVRQMGAREPGSVISLFTKAFPNLETQDEAAQLMNNALMMQSRWKQDRAQAAEQWELGQQKNAGAQGQGYKGLLGFEQQFAQTNSPNDYWRAAAAMSKDKDIAWQNTNDQQKQRIRALIPPGTIFRSWDGNLYQKPNM